MQGSDAARVERYFLARLVACPQDDGVTAQVEHQGESAVTVRRCRQRLETVRSRLQGDVPAVIGPWCMRDADLAEHLRSEVQDGERLVIPFDAQFRPVAHRVRP